jgi:hypothetical protein
MPQQRQHQVVLNLIFHRRICSLLPCVQLLQHVQVGLGVTTLGWKNEAPWGHKSHAAALALMNLM